MIVIKKTRNIKCWWGCREKGMLLQFEWECKLLQPSWASQVAQTGKNLPPVWGTPVWFLVRKILWRRTWQQPNWKKLKTELPHDPAISHLNILPMEYIWVCVYRHIYNEILFSLKIGIPLFVITWIKLEGIMLSKISLIEINTMYYLYRNIKKKFELNC